MRRHSNMRGGCNMDSLEMLVDHEGLSGVLSMLTEICFMKEEHIDTNWQDRKLAKLWGQAGGRVDKLQDTLAEWGL